VAASTRKSENRSAAWLSRRRAVAQSLARARSLSLHQRSPSALRAHATEPWGTDLPPKQRGGHNARAAVRATIDRAVAMRKLSVHARFERA